MRKTTLASLLIVCGSTAALAQVVSPAGQAQNNIVESDNQALPEPLMTNDAVDTMEPASPNGTMGNEANPTPR